MDRPLGNMEKFIYKLDANVVVRVDLSKAVCFKRLEASFTKVFKKHVLASSQIKRKHGKLFFCKNSIPSSLSLEKDKSLQKYIEEETVHLFKPEEPLIKLTVLEDHNKHYLSITTHHVICDGCSLVEFCYDLFQEYDHPGKIVSSMSLPAQTEKYIDLRVEDIHVNPLFYNKSCYKSFIQKNIQVRSIKNIVAHTSLSSTSSNLFVLFAKVLFKVLSVDALIKSECVDLRRFLGIKNKSMCFLSTALAADIFTKKNLLQEVLIFKKKLEILLKKPSLICSNHVEQPKKYLKVDFSYINTKSIKKLQTFKIIKNIQFFGTSFSNNGQVVLFVLLNKFRDNLNYNICFDKRLIAPEDVQLISDLYGKLLYFYGNKKIREKSITQVA